MKRAILPALGLALLLALPAIPQDGGNDLQDEVDTLKEQVELQEKQIKELKEYVANQQKQAAALSKALGRAEKEGFLLPAPNNDAKKALLSGLKQFASVAAGGAPKADDDEGEESED